MKITLNREDLRMVVLKQIVANASIGLKTERNISLIGWLIPFTPNKMKLKRLRKRGDRLQMFEVALSKSKSELVEIDFEDVNFIYRGLTSWPT